MRDGKTKRQTERKIKANEWGEERRIGHCADQVHHYTAFQETNHNKEVLQLVLLPKIFLYLLPEFID